MQSVLWPQDQPWLIRFTALAFLGGLAGLAQTADTTARGLALRVVDGDTLVLQGETIRLNGIDAPELAQTCRSAKGRETRCGKDAKAALEKLAASGPLECRGTDLDGYGRRLATCYANGHDINARMVRLGHAFAFRKYSLAYVREEDLARKEHAGVFAGTVQPPWEFRARKWQVAAQASDQTAPPGCPIKGNISGNGKIYHTPWSPSYGRTRIDPSRGERWFCSEDEAIAAGWRAPG